MTDIQNRIFQAEQSRENLKNHPLAFTVEECKRSIIVTLPYNIRGIDGVRASKEIGVTKAITQIIGKLEELWMESTL